jgi:hypothetical protein
MENVNESILDKMKKLLAKAESAKEIGSLAEAEAFMAKVNELLMLHNLSMFDLHKHAAKGTDEFATWGYSERIVYKENLAGDQWKRLLLNVICKHNLTWSTIRKSDKTLCVYGDMQNVESTVWMFYFLETKLMVLAKQYMNELPKDVRDANCRHYHLKNFLIGAVDGLDTKLKKQTAESNNAMVVSNKTALDKFIRAKLPNIKEAKCMRVEAGNGYAEGFEAGSNMSLGARLAAAKSTEGKLLN